VTASTGPGRRHPRRETPATLRLRETAQRLKLRRKYKGRLVPTSKGRTLAGDPIGMWRHLAGALPVGGRESSNPEWQAGVLLLALMASGSTDNAEVTIAKLLTGLGWAVGDGRDTATEDHGQHNGPIEASTRQP
jgi:hypothetical protein